MLSETVFLEGREPPLTLRQENHYHVFWLLFPLYAMDFFPVVRHFFCRFPTEHVLYYKNLGLYYGLASTTLPLYAKPCAKVKGGCLSWVKLNRGVSKPGGFPLFSGKVQIVSRTLSGLFLVGAVNRPRKRKRTNRENARTIPEQIGKIPEKSGKSQKGQKRTQRKDKSRSGNPPV